MLKSIQLIKTGLLLSGLLYLSLTHAQPGRLLWQDNFDNFNRDIWNTDTGDGCDQGLCGWGNQELQWYLPDNIAIEDIHDEPGNRALAIYAKRQSAGGKSFTSGKIHSKDKLSVHYGMIEMRVKVPHLDTGLWPALWMLGTSAASWPAKGEIDLMEMGHSQAGRAMAGFPGAPINHYVGANLIFYAEAACNEFNPSCAASTAWQTDNAHLSPRPLSDRFVVYRLYWTEDAIRFSVVDQGEEHDLYQAPFHIGPESDEFRAPFYLLMNLAVGGAFTDALTPEQITAPLPAKMLVDYVRVYELDGQGTVTTGASEPVTGTFGVFSEASGLSAQLDAGVSSDIYLWNTQSTSDGGQAPFEGEAVISWHYHRPGDWFGGGVAARQALNLSQYSDGALQFNIKVPADISFKVGIVDTYTNEHWVSFPAHVNQYGLIRDGQWQQITLPISHLRGPLIALQSMKYPFAIASIGEQLPGDRFDIAIDNIVWLE